MSTWLKEEVVEMPPLSTASLEALAEQFLEEFFPDALVRASALDFVTLVERLLPAKGIHVVPVSIEELPDCHAVADHTGDGDVNILIREDIYDDLFSGTARAFFAVATIAHELAHVILHVPVLRRRRRLYGQAHDLVLRRVARGRIEAYRDPEWQAWTLAGAIVAPRRTLLPLVAARASVPAMARTFGISEKFMRARLRVLHIDAR